VIVSSEWIKGIPQQLHTQPSLLSRFLEEAYPTLNALEGGLFKIEVKQRGKGGMPVNGEPTQFAVLDDRIKADIKIYIGILISERISAAEDLTLSEEDREEMIEDLDVICSSPEASQAREKAKTEHREVLKECIDYIWRQEVASRTGASQEPPFSQPSSTAPKQPAPSQAKQEPSPPQPSNSKGLPDNPGLPADFHERSEEDVKQIYGEIAKREPREKLDLKNVDMIMNRWICTSANTVLSQSGPTMQSSISIIDVVSAANSTGAREAIGQQQEALIDYRRHASDGMDAMLEAVRGQNKIFREIGKEFVKDPSAFSMTQVNTIAAALTEQSRKNKEFFLAHANINNTTLQESFSKALVMYDTARDLFLTAIGELRKEREFNLQIYQKQVQTHLSMQLAQMKGMRKVLREVTSAKLTLMNQDMKNYIERNLADVEAEQRLILAKTKRELEIMDFKLRSFERVAELEMQKIAVKHKMKIDEMATQLQNRLVEISREMNRQQALHQLEMQKLEKQEEIVQAQRKFEASMNKLKHQQALEQKQFEHHAQMEEEKFKAEQARVKQLHEKNMKQLEVEKAAQEARLQAVAEADKVKNARIQKEYEGLLAIYNKEVEALENYRHHLRSKGGNITVHENYPPRISGDRVIPGKVRFSYHGHT
jgi:hypothetical protein